MNNNKLLIYDFNELYEILNEIKDKINFEVLNITEDDIEKIGINKDYLIITKKKLAIFEINSSSTIFQFQYTNY